MGNHADDIVRVLAIASLILVTSQKIIVMQRETQRWNGLGKALRFEKASMLIFWVWLLLRPLSEILRSVWMLVLLAILITYAEWMVSHHLRRFTVREKEPKDRRDLRQDRREDSLDLRARGLDERGTEMSREMIRRTREDGQ